MRPSKPSGTAGQFEKVEHSFVNVEAGKFSKINAISASQIIYDALPGASQYTYVHQICTICTYRKRYTVLIS